MPTFFKNPYKALASLICFIAVVPFPNTLFGLTDNTVILAYLLVLIPMMLFLRSDQFYTLEVRKGLLILYLFIFSILLLNLSSQFALTFYLRVLFAIIAAWFLKFWFALFTEDELIDLLKKILYSVGIVSFLLHLIRPPEDGRLSSLFDVHTGKYFFFAFVIIFTHRVLLTNKKSDYIALGTSFFLLSLSLQRGILLTAICFLLLVFRAKIFKQLTWIVLLGIICFALGFFDPLIDRLFFESPVGGDVEDMLSNINSSGRLEFWLYLWMNEDITFFGSGLGHSIEIGKAMFEGLNLVHNDFLWLLIDTGIYGIAVLFGVLFYIYRAIKRIPDKLFRRIFYSLLFSIPIIMYVDNFTFHVYIYFPLLFGYFEFYRTRSDAKSPSTEYSNVQLG